MAAAEESPEEALTRLDARLAAHPDDLEALAERADARGATGRWMGAFLDRQEILRRRPEDVGVARLAAYDLAAAGAPQAAAAFLERYPAALSGEAGAALVRRLEGDLAARHIRWGWAEPVFDPAQRHHEAEAAIAALEAIHRSDPGDARATGDLLLAYRLAGRMEDVVTLWETAVRRDDAPYWLRNAAADAYLALHRPAEAEALYRSFADERAGSPEPWLGLYWATIEQRRYDDAAAALDELGEDPRPGADGGDPAGVAAALPGPHRGRAGAFRGPVRPASGRPAGARGAGHRLSRGRDGRAAAWARSRSCSPAPPSTCRASTTPPRGSPAPERSRRSAISPGAAAGRRPGGALPRERPRPAAAPRHRHPACARGAAGGALRHLRPRARRVVEPARGERAAGHPGAARGRRLRAAAPRTIATRAATSGMPISACRCAPTTG